MGNQRQPFTKSECTEENKCDLPSANGNIEHFYKNRIFGSGQKPSPFRTTKLKQYGVDLHKPHSDNPGGLNGSMQHLLKALLSEPRMPISHAELNSNKTKALFRF